MEEEKAENISEVEATGNNTLSDVSLPSKGATFLKGRLLIGLLVGAIVLILLLLLGLNIISSRNNPQTGKAPPPEPENVLLATVGSKKIYRNDVRAVALEQYVSSGINSQIMKLSLNIAVERAILDNEAETKKIVAEKGKNKIEYYDNLKKAIMLRTVGTVTANTIGYWVPAFHDIYPQKPEYQQMRDLQNKIFSDATVSLQQGKTTYEIGKSILENYPVYKDQLSVNSYRIAKTDDITLMQKPVVYQYLVNESNKALVDFIFSLKKGQIKTYTWPDGEGGELVQIVDQNVGPKTTYEQWLKEKEKPVIYDQKNMSLL